MREFDLAIVIPCSKTKRTCPEAPASPDELEDLRNPPSRLRPYSLPARNLYLGRQHRALVATVDAFRKRRPDLRTGLFIVSAGYGLLEEREPVVPYEAPLGQTRADWERRGQELGLPGQIASLGKRARHVIVTLSAAYLTAAQLPTPELTNFVYLAGTDFATRHPTARFVLAGREQARRYRKAERDVRAVVLERLLRTIACRGLEALSAPDLNVLVTDAPAEPQLSLTLQ